MKKWLESFLSDNNRVLFLLALSNFVFAWVKLRQYREVDRDMESRIKAELTAVLLKRFDEVNYAYSSSVSKGHSDVQSPDSVVSDFPCVYAPEWEYGCDGRRNFLIADGSRLYVGDSCEYGVILNISPRLVRCSSADIVLGKQISVSKSKGAVK